MAYMTDESMDEIGYELAQFAAMDGMDDIERFVSLNAFEKGECIHDNGMWNDEFSAWDHRSTFECVDCDYVLEV